MNWEHDRGDLELKRRVHSVLSDSMTIHSKSNVVRLQLPRFYENANEHQRDARIPPLLGRREALHCDANISVGSRMACLMVLMEHPTQLQAETQYY